MKKIKSVHFVGIKGAGMTPLAIIAKQAGFNVTGSDLTDVFITDDVLKKMNILPFKGFSKSHVGNVDLVIATGAHGGLDNIEVKTAKKRGVPVVTQGEAVGLFMEGSVIGRKFTGISVSGTNGKTTTAAMIATMLKSAGLFPSYMIGTSFIQSLGYSGHLGNGKYFVAEADEYATDPVFVKSAKFLWQNPKIIVITNIDFDHPDIYSNIEEVKKAFKKFILKLPPDGLLAAYGDDPNTRDVIRFYKGKKMTYGFSKENDFVISDILYRHSGKRSASRISNVAERFWTSQNDESRVGMEFKIIEKGRSLGKFSLNIFGEQNVLNATASIIVGRYLGFTLDQLKKGIASYKGSKRRSEFIGKLLSGALVFDDYAHNPTKVTATLKAFRDAYPNKRIVCIFQPHTYSRTKSLFEQFTHSFNDADTVIITNIYASLREKKDPSVSSKQLADAIQFSPRRSHGFQPATSEVARPGTVWHLARQQPRLLGGERFGNVVFLPQLQDVVEYIDKKKYGEDTIIITMGAGDIYKISQKLKVKS